MPRIDIAEQPGVGLDGLPRPTEDRVVVTTNAVAVLDGATEFRAGMLSGGWYSHRLAEYLEASLTTSPAAPLRTVLAAAIENVALTHGLRPGHSPSSTVAIARWTTETVDALVLADSPVVAFGHLGTTVVADHRLARLRHGGFLRTRADVDRLRNHEDGFWVAEADPAAASHAVCVSWPRRDVEAVLLATDGVSVGVDDYGLFDWPDVVDLARGEGAKAVLDAVRRAELADPDGVRWPRVKQHDDQALAVIDFTMDQG
ncbi:protein phosphatase 2C domain-containing protein [Prauserella oleivorans]|uniref:Protein phosphatase 2C domain-containing protein n=1 Tax=Prauserella oleivorans TaxID=1478153 RepID=A0ABW5W660_9PSEU